MNTNSNLTPDENAKLLPIRVVLADDHELVLKGLRGILKQEPDMDVVGSAMNGRDLLADCLLYTSPSPRDS